MEEVVGSIPTRSTNFNHLHSSQQLSEQTLRIWKRSASGRAFFIQRFSAIILGVWPEIGRKFLMMLGLEQRLSGCLIAG